MNEFLTFILLGLSLSAPVGPITAAQLENGMKNGFWNAWLLGLGAMFADAAFMVLVIFGIAEFMDLPPIKLFLWTFGFLLLTCMGIESFRSAGSLSPSPSFRSSNHPAKSFLAGFSIAVSNPLNILFWLGIYGAAFTDISGAGLRFILLSSLGIFAGILLWDLFIAFLSSLFRRYLHPAMLHAISILAGCCLLGFGLSFGWQAYHFYFH